MGVVLTDIIENLKFVKKIMGFKKVLRDFKDGKDTYPISIQVQTQSSCNARCVFCPYPYTSKITSQGKMEWTTFKKIVDECAEFPNLTNFVPMLQNEPLLDKDICRAISYAKEKSNGRLIVSLSTNAHNIANGLVEDLMSSGLDYLSISLNAFYKKTYEALLPGFNFEKVMTNIEKILSCSNGKTKIVDECAEFPNLTNFVPMLQNEPLLDKDICRAISYAKEKSNGRLIVSLSTNAHNIANGLVEDLMSSGLDYLSISLNAFYKKTYE